MALATIIAGSTTAHAQRRMVVLIDASGSMTIARPADLVNPTRFDAAKSRAKSQIVDQAGLGLSGVAVYTFSDATATQQTAGFVTANAAIAVIDGLDLFTVGGGVTPLAGSVCDAVDALVLDGGTTKILQLASDGEENSTPLAHPCQGPFSVDPAPPFSGGSWQNKVLNKVVDAGVAVQIDLFNPAPIIGLAARAARAPDPEGAITAKSRLITAIAAVAAGEDPPTLEEFFADLARESGGRLTVVNDDVAQVPVSGDLNGNNCVDRSDALLVARAIGQSGPPQDNPLDLDLDGRVSFADYALALGRRTPGGCGVADPFVARAPILCIGRTVVIDGQAIEGGGVTIDARGACNLIIRNSLVVSGSNAIKILGGALVTIDNSIIVGENAVIASQGVSVLSAANTVFHGRRVITGALAFLDRGGNIWE